jgi:hypothetical protein
MDEYQSFISNLGKYEESLQQEYEIATNAEDTTQVRKLIEQKIAQALPGFVDDLILIAKIGDTDSARLKAIQFAFNWYFANNTSAADPFSVLLGELTKNDKRSQDPQNPNLNPDLNPQLRKEPTDG